MTEYEFHMRNETHDREEGGVDPETGWRFQYWDVGMTRNAKAENKSRMKVFLDPMPHVVMDQNIPLRGWYKSKFEPKNVRPRPCFTDAILTQPYGGFCHVGCGFCYINNGTRGYRGQGVTTVDPAYGEKVRKQLQGMRKSAAVYMSSFIDPFLELEDYYHNTQACSQAALDVGLPIFFLTRKQVPGWAYDHLLQNPHSYMQFSINTPDPEDWKKLSPKALPLEGMIDQVREMRRRGIYVSIQVNPIVAGIVSNEQIVELIHILAEAGANHLIFKYVEIVYPSVTALLDQMRRRFKARCDKLEELFTQNIGGVRTIAEEYRKVGLDMFLRETKKAGVTMSLCYEYEYERSEAGEILSKTGVSMGRRYITSDQCHGHRVPIYVRDSAEEMFRPLEMCPDGGCLHCADDNDGPLCGDDEMGKAKAWTPNDLKIPVEVTKC